MDLISEDAMLNLKPDELHQYLDLLEINRKEIQHQQVHKLLKEEKKECIDLKGMDWDRRKKELMEFVDEEIRSTIRMGGSCWAFLSGVCSFCGHKKRDMQEYKKQKMVCDEAGVCPACANTK